MFGDQLVARVRINSLAIWRNNRHRTVKAVSTRVRQQVGERAILLTHLGIKTRRPVFDCDQCGPGSQQLCNRCNSRGARRVAKSMGDTVAINDADRCVVRGPFANEIERPHRAILRRELVRQREMPGRATDAH